MLVLGMQRLTSKILATFIFVVFVSLIINSGEVSAQNSDGADPCQPSAEGTQALGQLPGGIYNVYAKLGNTSDTENVEVYFGPVEGFGSAITECVLIADGEASGEEYRVLGAVELGGDAVLGSVSIVYNEDTAGILAPPSVVFIPQGYPACNPETGCLVNFEGQDMELLPQKISLATSRLNLGLLQPITDTSISEVVYSIDDVPVYTSRELNDFNLNYVPSGNHKLQRSVLLNSGQILRQTEEVRRGSPGQLHYSLIAYYYRHHTIFNIVIFISIIVIAAIIALAVVDSTRRRRHWQSTHTAGVVNNFQAEREKILEELNAPPREESYLETAWRYKWWLSGLSGILLVLVIISTQIMTIFTVHGPSMETTLRSGSKRVVLKLPVTFARLNGSVFTPERGQVVVFKQKANHFLGSEAVQASASFVVKRVIGLPGERVVIKEGIITVYRNGVAFVPDDNGDWKQVIEPSEEFLIDLVLGPGELFVVGDNRRDSLDSRTYGAINTTDIVGVVK